MPRRTIIHVNGHNLKSNKVGRNREKPVFTVKDYKQNRKGNLVLIHGPSELIFSDSPLKSGAVAWIETYSDVDVFV